MRQPLLGAEDLVLFQSLQHLFPAEVSEDILVIDRDIHLNHSFLYTRIRKQGSTLRLGREYIGAMQEASPNY